MKMSQLFFTLNKKAKNNNENRERGIYWIFEVLPLELREKKLINLKSL